MIDPEMHIKVLCEDCGCRHAPIQECSFERAYGKYVEENYLGSGSEPISRDWFREEIWNGGNR